MQTHDSEFIISISRGNNVPHSCCESNHSTHRGKKKTGWEGCCGRRKEEEEEEWKGLWGRDSGIVSLHAPVPAVILALCLSLSTGDVWLLGTIARGWKLKGQRIFQTTALQWAAIQEKLLYCTHSTGVKLSLGCHVQALLMANMMGEWAVRQWWNKYSDLVPKQRYQENNGRYLLTSNIS